jgi:flagellar motor protein MotB
MAQIQEASLSWFSSPDFGEQNNHPDPWSSIVDLMSAFTLVLFLAVIFFILNYNTADEKLKDREKSLIIQQGLLVKKEQQLERTKRDLESKDIALDHTEKARMLFKTQAEQLKHETERLRKAQEQLELEKKNLEMDKRRLEDEKQHLEREKSVLQTERNVLQADKHRLEGLNRENTLRVAEAKEETKKQEQFHRDAQASQERCERQLQALLKQKERVFNAIHQIFSAREVKKGSVGFDPQTGKFRLGGDVLFAEGQDQLTEDGKAQLRQVMYSLDNVVLLPDVRPMIAGIMVEGHTNIRGSHEINWELSSKRALSALQYMLSLTSKNKQRYDIYSRLLHATAFGQFRPINKANGQPDLQRSRRIEIRVVFHSQQRIQKILQGLKAQQ